MPKRLLFAALLFFISINYLSSCKTDFDVNAPYKEEYVIYGLLELNKPVQIIKISKAFQNSATVTANQAAQTPDSLNTPDDLMVQLIETRVDGGKTFASMVKYADSRKDPGLFAAPGQYLFKTPPGLVINAASKYKISLYNTKTGYRAEANTSVAGPIGPVRPTTTSQINFANTPGTYYPITFAVGNNAATYDVNINIPINTYDKKTNTILRKDTLVFNVFTNYSQTQGGRIIYNIQGSDFYRFIGASIKADTGTYHRLFDLDFTFTGAGADLTNYIQVTTPTLGIVQKKPDYTNVTNTNDNSPGLGIFSSRLNDHVVVPLTGGAYDLLISSEETKALNFRK